MSEDPRLEQLIEQWEDLRQEGREVSAEDLCRECPEFLEPLKQRIASLKSMDWLLESDSSESHAEIANAAWKKLPRTLGRYRLDEVVGTGGFGQVWKGFDPELQRTVAIKVPRLDRLASSGQADKFLAEARKVAQLRHTGIVPVHDVGRDGEWCFIVSDFIECGSLAERIKQQRADWLESTRLMAELAEILHYAHQQGFIHRDIKPGNILLDAEGKPYLADFGIAVSEGEGHSSGTAGTLAYMSPEQLMDGVSRIDHRADIYGLGVVFYELLTSQKPFTGNNPLDLRNAILSAQPTPPRVLVASLPVSLERTCLKAMAKDPAERYATAKDYATALNAVIGPKRWKLWIAGGILAVLLSALLAAMILRIWNPDADKAPHETMTTAHRPANRDELAEEIRAFAKSHPEVKPERSSDSVLKQQEAVKKIMEGTMNKYGIHRSDTRSPRDTDNNARATPVFEETLDLTARPVADSDFERIGGDLALRTLLLRSTPTTDTHLAWLKRNSLIETLDISETRITDEGLQHLARLPALADLSLANTAITNQGLKTIGPMHLRRLDLSNTKITDEGLGYLGHRHGLRDCLTELILTGTEVSDACVKVVKQMTRLKELHVGGTQLTDRGIGELHSSLPDCRIQK